MKPKNSSIFFTDLEDPSSFSLSNQFAEHLEFNLVRDKITAYPINLPNILNLI